MIVYAGASTTSETAATVLTFVLGIILLFILFNLLLLARNRFRIWRAKKILTPMFGVLSCTGCDYSGSTGFDNTGWFGNCFLLPHKPRTVRGRCTFYAQKATYPVGNFVGMSIGPTLFPDNEDKGKNLVLIKTKKSFS